MTNFFVALKITKALSDTITCAIIKTFLLKSKKPTVQNYILMPVLESALFYPHGIPSVIGFLLYAAGAMNKSISH